MKTWAEVESSPEFINASPKIKDEVRGFYKNQAQKNPKFQTLPEDQKDAVVKRIDGESDYAIKTAALIISAAKKEILGRAILDPQEKDDLENALKGAKSAEKYLDVPLKDRPREPFQDEIPGHLDKPLRTILGFIDDALPEYVPVKFWNVRQSETLEEKLRNVLALSSNQPQRPVDANAALNLPGFIHTYADLDKRIPTALPPLKQWPIENQEEALTKDPEAALKHGLPQVQWGPIDRSVITTLVHLLAGIKQGVPRAFRPDAVPLIVSEVKRLAYEMIARNLYHLPTATGSIPIDPERIGEVILASSALAPGMEKVADDFPSLFSVVAGIATVPESARGRYKNFLVQNIGTDLTPEILLKAVDSGKISFIKLAKMDETLFQEAAISSGARPVSLPHFIRDSMTAAQKPLLVSLLVRSEAMDRQDFKNKTDEVRQKVQVEVQNKIKPPEPTLPPLDFEDDNYREAFKGMFPDHRVDLIHFPVQEDTQWPENRPELPQESPKETKTSQDTPNAASATVEATETKSESESPNTKIGPIITYLIAHPISIKSVKKSGLYAEFIKYPDLLSKDGATLDETMKALVSEGLIPKKSDYNDLINAIEKELRGASTPPPDADAMPTTMDAPPASNLSEKVSAKKSIPDFTVHVVEVDPDSLIPTKTPSEIEPSRIRGAQQRFPEGKGYPAVAGYEDKAGIHLIDGHHRTMVAKERGDTIKAAVVSAKDYSALQDSGLDHIGIAYTILEKAGQSVATNHIRQQYPQKKFQGS